MAGVNRIVLRSRERILSVIALVVLLVSLVALAASPPAPISPASGCSFSTSGTTMVLTADCTTDVTIVIPNGFTLDGGWHKITAVDPAGGHFVGAVVRNGGASASVQYLEVTASGLANVCDAGGDRLRGILFDGASGTILNNIVKGINQGASGCQEGNGIEVRSEPFDGNHPATNQVTVADNEVRGYQKTGIVANGDVLVTVTGNLVVGVGPVPYIAQNGIQLGFGAMGEVRANDVSGNAYTGCSNQDAARTGCTPWVSAALLLYDVDPNAVQHSMNTFRDNQRNLLLIPSASLGNP